MCMICFIKAQTGATEFEKCPPLKINGNALLRCQIRICHLTQARWISAEVLNASLY